MASPTAAPDPSNLLVERLGRVYRVAHREGAVSVDALTIVRAPRKAFPIDSLAAHPAYMQRLVQELRAGRVTTEHVAVLHAPVYEPNPGQHMVARCYGVVFEAPDADADDPRLLRLLRYAPDRHSTSFGELCVDAATTEDGRTVRFCEVPRFTGLVPLPSAAQSTLSRAIATLKASTPYPAHVYPQLPTQAETLEWLAQTRGDDDAAGRAAFLRRSLDLVAELRGTRFGGVDLILSDVDLPQSQFFPDDDDDADRQIVGVFQRLGYGVLRFLPALGHGAHLCPYTVDLPGFAHSLHRQRIDWEDDVLMNDLTDESRCYNYFYPRTFRRIRQIGVLRCVPRLLAWLRSARIVLADPARPGVLAAEEAAVDAAMSAPVFTKGSLGKRRRAA